jgi:hypothetical protein
LIEAVAVLVIIGVLAAVVVARTGSTGAGLVVEQDILKAHLRYAQGLAMANNTAVWSVQVNAGGYTLRRDGAVSPIAWPDAASATRNFAGGVSVIQGAGEIVFDALGAPAMTHVIRLGDGDAERTVTVTGFTGLIP